MGIIELSSLDGFEKGDIAAISDEITQEEFGADVVEFIIKSVRTYVDTKENVKYTCYILGGLVEEDEEDDSETFMLTITEIDGFYDITLYFLDNAGDLSYEEGSKAPNYGNLIDPKEKDFAELVLLINSNGEDQRQIRWVRRGDSYMDLSCHDEQGVSQASLCEYSTQDDNFGNNLALIISSGSLKELEDNKIEMWYGYRIQDHEVEMFEKGTN